MRAAGFPAPDQFDPCKQIPLGIGKDSVAFQSASVGVLQRQTRRNENTPDLRLARAHTTTLVDDSCHTPERPQIKAKPCAVTAQEQAA